MNLADKRILIHDPDGKLDFPNAVRCTDQTDFLGFVRREKFDIGIVVAGKGTISTESFLKSIISRSPLMPIVAIGDVPAELRKFVDAIVDSTNKKRIADTIEEILTKREILANSGMVGRSEALYVVADVISRVAPTDITVLIEGESGTGKELVAQAIHKLSKRASKPFLPVNCGAIPETLLESQLFGHIRGSFTGADRTQPGFFGQVDDGTLFLDEIGEIPPSTQVKLLRVLETGEYYPVGASTPKHSMARVITATNRDLKIPTEQGLFRQDLYYRISGVKIFVPPLRERPEDIPVLAFYFANRIAEKNNIKPVNISQDVIDTMIKYHWPGNVRELKNLVENMVILSGDRQIKATDLLPYFSDHALVGRHLPAKLSQASPQNDKLSLVISMLEQQNKLLEMIAEKISSPSLEDAELSAVKRAMHLAGGNRKKTAQILGISERTLYRKLKKIREEKL